MAEYPSPVEKRSIPRVKRTKLEQFPCYRVDAEFSSCHHGERECWFRDECRYWPIYEQAIADQRCARVLLALKKWWWDKHYWPDIFVGVSGDPGSMRVVRFRNWMNAALDRAGLL